MTPLKPKRNPKVVALIVTLVAILVVLPAAATIVVRIAKARWVAAHPAEALVPDVIGSDWQAAAAAVRSAQLKPVISSTAIDAKCWQDQPAADTIVDQDPEPLTPVTVGTHVHLVIGRAPKKGT
jgi:beta-lactam-binding protein with PASTA domain